MRLGFFGPAGTFTHAALLASPRAAGRTVEAVPFASERETILAAQSGAVDAALVPIENSLEGGVNATLDTLALDATGVRIVGEEVLPISHALIARDGIALADVEAVLSHPQPLGQCRRFLDDVLPAARRVAATSTAEAVRLVAESPERWAAIGTTAAAALHRCTVLREGIEDEHGNETRFLWVAAEGTEPFAEGADPFAGGAGSSGAERPEYKTSLVFHGAGDAVSGWLVGCLSELASRDINLTRIESRPLKRQLGHYLFLADLEGRADDARVAEAIEGLRAHCSVVRVLGSYPVA